MSVTLELVAYEVAFSKADFLSLLIVNALSFLLVKAKGVKRLVFDLVFTYFLAAGAKPNYLLLRYRLTNVKWQPPRECDHLRSLAEVRE